MPRTPPVHTAANAPSMTDTTPSTPQDARCHLDTLLRDGRVPGVQYLVVSAGEVEFEYAGGLADVAGGHPLDATTTMMAYSMSKTITAAAVLQLVEARAVALDAPIASYLPSQPYGPRVTVRQLLAHTAGIPNPLPLKWAHAASYHADFDEMAELQRILQQHPRLTAEPGARFRYANIGYWLLGAMVEQVTGARFTSYVRNRILAPLGITPAELGYGVVSASGHAKGYLERRSLLNVLKGFLIDRALIGEYEGRWLHIRDHYVNGAAVGGLVGSARAFGTFLQDQLRPDSVLFEGATRALFYAPQRTANGKEVPMTLGWHIGALGGQRHFFKEGGGGGFHCMMRLYPSAGVATVVMVNATTFNVSRLLDAIDPAFLSPGVDRS